MHCNEGTKASNKNPEKKEKGGKNKNEVQKQKPNEKIFTVKFKRKDALFFEELKFEHLVAGTDPLRALLLKLYGYYPESINTAIQKYRSKIGIFFHKKSQEEKIASEHFYRHLYPKPILPEFVTQIENKFTATTVFTHYFLLKIQAKNPPFYSCLLNRLEKTGK